MQQVVSRLVLLVARRTTILITIGAMIFFVLGAWSSSQYHQIQQLRHELQPAMFSKKVPQEQDSDSGSTAFFFDCHDNGKNNQNFTKHPHSNVSISEFYSPDSTCSHNLTSSVIFFHVGKAGGGTISMHFQNYRLNVRLNHPRPSKKDVQSLLQTTASTTAASAASNLNISHNNTPNTLIINIRDPVDRFVSTFQWRLLRLCAPNDTRIQVKMGGTEDVDTMCKTSKQFKTEEKMLRETYDSNPNVMAEALCGDGDEAVLHDMTKIGHSTRLVEWLDLLLMTNKNNNNTTGGTASSAVNSFGIANFMVLPLETQTQTIPNGRKVEVLSFEQHIDKLAVTLLERQYRQDAAEQIQKILQSSDSQSSSEEAERKKHSTSTYTNNQTTKHSPLTPLGECCLTRYYEDDYRLIQSMLVSQTSSPPSSSSSLGNDEINDMIIIQPLENVHPIIQTACSWGDEAQQYSCRLDLQSILLRRAKYLNSISSGGSCEKLASGM